MKVDHGFVVLLNHRGAGSRDGPIVQDSDLDVRTRIVLSLRLVISSVFSPHHFVSVLAQLFELLVCHSIVRACLFHGQGACGLWHVDFKVRGDLIEDDLGSLFD